VDSPALRAPPPLIGALGIMSNSNEPDAKVLFRTPEGNGTFQVETLWAYSLGDDKYKLDNSPFYAYSVSWEDIVYAPYDPVEARPTFQRIVTKSGNRTIRVLLDSPIEDNNASYEIAQGLLHLGCSYEGATRSYLSVNIPPNTQLEDVRQYLTEKDIQWEHADPTYAELYPDDA